MADAYSRDLERWIPRLIAVWRQARRKGDGPETRLTPQEVKEVGAGVKQLSLGLTRERQLAGAKYMDDPRLLGAYLLFYWPVSYAQARQALGELPNRPRQVLDLGSGPGPAGLRRDGRGGQRGDGRRPEQARADARPDLWPPRQARRWPPGSGTRRARRRLPRASSISSPWATSSTSCTGRGTGPSDLGAALLEQLLGQVKKGGSLLVMEPALRETSRALLKVRDVLVGKGYAVRAPCMFRGNCPALVKETDWCHAERTWPMPKVVEELARAAGLHKESLKMSYLMLAPKGEAWPELPQGRLFRIVSEPLEGKGRHRYIGCGPEGRVGLAMQEQAPHGEERALLQAVPGRRHLGDARRSPRATAWRWMTARR